LGWKGRRVNRNRLIAVSLGVALLVAALVAALLPAGKGDTEILVLCGGSMRPAMEEVIAGYRSTLPADSPVTVTLTTGSSGDLAAQMVNTQKGDIYVCHDPWIKWCEERKLVTDWRPVAGLKVVIGVQKGNPKGIRSMEDLARPGIRLAVGSPKHSTSGVITEEVLKKAEYGDAVRKNISLEARVHGKRSADLAFGLLDAAFIWNAVAHTYREKIDAVPIDDRLVDAVTSATYGRSDLRNVKVSIGITASAGKREEVREFWEYATTTGRKAFERNGFTPAE